MRTKLSFLLIVATVCGASCVVTMNLGYDLPDEGTGGTGGVEVCESGAVEPCYTGPEGTEGVGLCRTGTMTCKEDGSGYDACQGEILPTAENCATPTDEDCDGVAPPCTGALLWAKSFGDTQDQAAFSISTDTGGGIWLAGALAGSADFGAGSISSAGSTDAFIVRLDEWGEHISSTRFGDFAEQAVTSIKTDPTGGATVAGIFDGTIAFNSPMTTLGGFDVFLARVSASAEPAWLTRMGGVGLQTSALTANDSTGSTIVTGIFSGAADFGSGLVVSAGATDVFLVKLDASGVPVWSETYGDSSAQTVSGIVTDNNNNVIICGRFSGAMSFGAVTLVSAGANDNFVAKIDPTGAPVWSMQLGDSTDQGAIDIATDSNGNIVIAGSLKGTIELGGSTFTSVGGSDIFVTKLAPDGTPKWIRQFGDASDQSGLRIATDGAGNIAIVGHFGGSVDFGGGPLASAGLKDAYVVKLDGVGEHLWSRRFGGAASETWIGGISVDSVGNTVVTGYYGTAIDFGSINFSSAGGTDIFVAKFAP